MGFFKDFKNDMKQAVNELIPGNDEMVSEYDDEDMVNTLEEQPADGEYVNTMEESQTTESPKEEDDILDDIDLADLEDFDLEGEDFVDESEQPAAPEQAAKPVVEETKAETVVEPAPEPEQAQEVPEAEEVAASAPEPEKPEVKEAEPETVPQAEATSPEESVGVEPASDGAEKAEAVAATSADNSSSKENAVMAEDKVIEISKIKETEAPKKPEPPKASEPTEDLEASDSTAYITKGTKIEGNLFTDGSIDILGTVIGDVNCYGKLIASGSIKGKVEASEIYANAARIEGEIVSAGSVKIGVGSVIVGNIVAQSAVIAGAVKGDLDVQGPVIVDSTAVIMGNIESRSVQINNGAVIQGFCSQKYSDTDVNSFFA